MDTRDAFLVVEDASNLTIHELRQGQKCQVGGRGADVFLSAASDVRFALEWTGRQFQLRVKTGAIFVQGKPADARMALRAGEEITTGGTRIALGVSVPLHAPKRRALSHTEFRERLYEELARARRADRPTTLGIVCTKVGDGNGVLSRALESFRAGDLVGTFAPDRLEILLPDTDIQAAQSVFGRIFAGLNVEIGLATAPQHAESAERLLRAAMSSANEARKLGRDEKTPIAIATNPPTTTHRGPVELVTQDPRSAAARDALARSKANEERFVLLYGERSAGKSAFARILHQDWDAPFVLIHCARVTEIDAAMAAAASGGSLLLDEITDLSLEAQVRLAAILKGARSVRRVIATTDAVLSSLVERGVFAKELEALFADCRIEIPSLRSRTADVLPLAQSFAPDYQFSIGAVARLRSYPWPGNVLELRNAVERACLLSDEKKILGEHLPAEPVTAAADEGRLRAHVDSVERAAIVKALADSNHNQTHAAKKLGVSRRALIYKMEKYGLKRPPRGSRRSKA